MNNGNVNGEDGIVEQTESKETPDNSSSSLPIRPPSPTPLVIQANENGEGDDNTTTTTPSSSPLPANQQEDNNPKIPDHTCNQGSGNSVSIGAVAVAAGGKRVRFSICEYITETLVHENGSHANPAFDSETERNGMDDTSDDNGGSKVRYIGGKLRRDSVHPLVPFHESIHHHQQQEKDKWDVILPGDGEEEDDEKGGGVPWADLSTKGKILRVSIGIAKFIGLLGLLYFFVCSLDLLALGFRLVGGRTAGDIFQKSEILQNPVVGLMLGILTTVLVQSSSTSTSILVGMVAAGFMDVRIAIPPIMGANIGTSITNTIVSFTQAGDRDQFRRAFAGATILDMFNWLTVLVLLPVEVVFGYLYHISKAATDLIIPDSQGGGEIQVLSVITNPFVDLIVQLNDTVLDCWANPNCTEADDSSLVKEFCSSTRTEIIVQERVVDLNGKEVLNIRDVTRQDDLQKCDFLFAGTSMSDALIGGIILAASLIVLCVCLVMIVKLLSSVLKGHVSTIIKHTLNANIPYVPWITGYLAIIVGAVMTFIVQSSSVFTSALTPLVGMGVISLSRVYPLTLGANIGTTTTALLAAMAAEGKDLHPSLQIALCHFFFNITGVILFYPLPFLRFPIQMAKVLGTITAKYRWFAIFYLVAMFAVIPVVFITLSLAGSIYVIILVSIIGAVVGLIAFITILQRKVPQVLPQWLKDWKWMPEPFRSLKPYDDILTKRCCCGSGDLDDDEDDDDDEDGFTYEKNRSSLDGDFVFLTGNKIPPPGNGFSQDNRIPPPPIITRIVPTRVIRQISNEDSYQNGSPVSMNPGNGEISQSISSSSPTPANNSNTSSSNSNNNKINRHNSILRNNTVPIPSASLAQNESLPGAPANLQNGATRDMINGNDNNLQSHLDLDESFLV